MSLRSGAKIGKIVKVLVYYDEPQLILLKSDRDIDVLGLAVRRPDMERPFFACEVRDRILERYLSQKADLHFAFSQAIGSQYYFFDLGTAVDDKVKFTIAKSEEAKTEAYWPKQGFFARSHTDRYQIADTSTGIRKSFRIDGRWGAQDFSKFHGKMSDLYALFTFLSRLDGKQAADVRQYIGQAIQERLWQGGGSYGSFYDSLSDRMTELRTNPLDIDAIQYASPGEIVVRGNKDALADITQVLDAFVRNRIDLKKEYGEIYSILRREKLLSAPPDSAFSSRALHSFVLEKTKKMASAMDVQKTDEMLEMCNNNALIFAKLVLSIYRRANELYSFYEEGRVQS